MRFGIVAIAIRNEGMIPSVNSCIVQNNLIILGRMGIPIRDRGIKLISLMVEGDTDAIGKMAGAIGQLEGVTVKSLVISG